MGVVVQLLRRAAPEKTQAPHRQVRTESPPRAPLATDFKPVTFQVDDRQPDELPAHGPHRQPGRGDAQRPADRAADADAE